MYTMFRGKPVVCGLVLVLVVAGSIALLPPRLHDSFMLKPRTGCSKTDTADGAYRADLRFLAGLGSASSLVQLTDAGESSTEILKNLKSYRALVVVTAGRSALTRRSEDQPFISLASDERQQPEQQQQQPESHQPLQQHQQAVVQQELRVQRPLELGQPRQHQQLQRQELQTDVERGRALRESQEDLDDDDGNGDDDVRERQGEGRGGAVRTAAATSSGLAALEAAVGLMNAGAAGLERVLGRRLFPITISLYDRTAGGTITTGPYAIFDASAGRLLLDEQFVSYTWGDDKPQVSYIAGQLAGRVFVQMADLLRPASPPAAASEQPATDPAQDPLAAATAAAAGGELPAHRVGSSTAAVAAQVVTVALAAVLPVAFAATPPLWFCVLCPSVLGLLAPLVINLALNQVAGALCSQLHLTDDVCFDVLLGALGAGFVLSLVSAVPIFFVCRLPQCAGHNVTVALRRLQGGV